MKKSGASQGQSASELISKRIAELGDWRGDTLSRMRKLIKEADPDVVEEWKWMGTPIWSHDGIICTGESYKNVVKLTFSKGASLKDPVRQGEEVDESAFKALVRQAGRPQQFWQVETFEESEVLARIARGCPARAWLPAIACAPGAPSSACVRRESERPRSPTCSRAREPRRAWCAARSCGRASPSRGASPTSDCTSDVSTAFAPRGCDR